MQTREISLTAMYANRNPYIVFSKKRLSHTACSEHLWQKTNVFLTYTRWVPPGLRGWESLRALSPH